MSFYFIFIILFSNALKAENRKQDAMKKRQNAPGKPKANKILPVYDTSPPLKLHITIRI